MRQTAVVIAPGRGTYNAAELGYLARHHADKAAIWSDWDARRAALGQTLVTALDGADRFSVATHMRGDNASPLILAAAYGDYLSIDKERFEIVAVTGNSMGWYIALTCAGALAPTGGFEVVNMMGTLMHEASIGGQMIYPVVGEDWRPDPGRRAAVLDHIARIDAQGGQTLGVSIDLGGMIVVAGDEAGLAAFAAAVPPMGSRFPMRLTHHGGFHHPMQAPVAARGRDRLSPRLFEQPNVPLIDGRGAIWQPKACDLLALYDYTLGHQVTAPYDFAAAVRVATHEFMPDVFIVLGPGRTLGGATAQALVAQAWRGMGDKGAFRSSDPARLILMGDDAQRGLVTGNKSRTR